MIPLRWILLAALLAGFVVHASKGESDFPTIPTNSRKRGRDGDSGTQVSHFYVISTANIQRLSVNSIAYINIGNQPVKVTADDKADQANGTVELSIVEVDEGQSSSASTSSSRDNFVAGSTSSSSGEESDNDVKIYSRYCNVKNLQQHNLNKQAGNLIPGNFILLSDKPFEQCHVNVLMHGIQIGALGWTNIKSALLAMFLDIDIWMVLLQDFPCPTELTVPQIDEYSQCGKQQEKGLVLWVSWPLKLYDEKEKEKCIQKFDSSKEKDAVLLAPNNEACQNTIFSKYPQLSLFTKISRDLSFSKPWTLYESLLSGTFVPSVLTNKENLVIAFYLIARDAENIKQLLPEYEAALSAAEQYDEVTASDSFVKLSLLMLSLFGVCEGTLKRLLEEKYLPSTLFVEHLNEDDRIPPLPEAFMMAVDKRQLPELHILDISLALSLIRHFLLCPPPSDIYLRTLLWIHRDVARSADLATIDRIRRQIRDQASLKAWEFANEHCSGRVRKRSNNKKRARHSLSNE